MFPGYKYEWYIRRTLSLAVWEGKQIGGHLVWQISSFIVIDLDKTTVLAVILIWQSELICQTAKLKSLPNVPRIRYVFKHTSDLYPCFSF